MSSITRFSLILGRAARSLAAKTCDAHAEACEQGATAGDSHRDPSNHVVDPHEVSGLGLHKIGLIKSHGGVVGLLVTASVSALSIESPDNASNVPGEATAAATAAGKTDTAREDFLADQCTE